MLCDFWLADEPRLAALTIEVRPQFSRQAGAELIIEAIVRHVIR
jgi:hypothetical protein